ncbi:MAG: MFS transporter [Acidimicrobiales bacterium]|nr:MFS transporter [Acidimicrobiales bacterium]MCB1016585.1 MFS transporter [Acidimicrobiales bacterium]MCB9374214.1 MFS transporter [Microthrixaceae bacterium]
MVLDQAVMNVSISQLVEDFDTEVTTIQAVITLYSLVMAALMITGGKCGDLWGRKRAFRLGLVVYACGSALTAASWTVGTLALGWSILEGIGAALVMPALAALVAGNFTGKARAGAYAVLGGVGGAGIAVGPILGGWVTTNLTWRLVFVGEVVLVAVILVLARSLEDAPVERRPQLDLVGALLSASGLTLIVLGALQSGTWGWVQPRNAPVEPFGFAPTLFVIAAGGALLYAFTRWQHRRARTGRDPLVRLERLRIPALRSGLVMFLAQNTVLLGLFFILPLYLQIVQGYDAFETGLRMLPVSVTMLATSLLGARLAGRAGPRRVVRVGLVVILASCAGLLSVLEPQIDTTAFLVTMGVLGVGMGLIVSQLGNVVQSSVGEDGRSEAGGLQNTALQLGAALGTALIGAVVVGALASSFLAQVQDNPAVSDATQAQVGIQLEAGVSFVSEPQARAAVTAAGLPPAEGDALVAAYADAQLAALKGGVLLAAGIALLSFAGTSHLPGAGRDESDGAAPAGDGPAPAVA